MEHRHVAVARRRVAPRPNRRPRRSSSIVQREDVGLVPPRAEQIAQAPRVVADGVAAVRRGHPLVDDHRRVRSRRRCPVPRRRPGLRASGSARNAAGRYCRSSSSSSASRNCRQKSYADAARAAPRSRRAPARRSRARVPAKSCARSRASAASCAPSTRVLERRGRSTIASHRARATRRGSCDVVQHAAAVHRRGNGRRGVGEDRHALVERLDERHAEAFVLAGAEEHVGDVVERRQLLVA